MFRLVLALTVLLLSGCVTVVLEEPVPYRTPTRVAPVSFTKSACLIHSYGRVEYGRGRGWYQVGNVSSAVRRVQINMNPHRACRRHQILSCQLVPGTAQYPQPLYHCSPLYRW